jgi:hypothetical protein
MFILAPTRVCAYSHTGPVFELRSVQGLRSSEVRTNGKTYAWKKILEGSDDDVEQLGVSERCPAPRLK